MDIKNPTTFEEQIEKLKSRGCIITDEDYTKQILQHVNYYRLTAYFLPFKTNDNRYKNGTSFECVHRIYEFDRKLRNLIFMIVEEIELTLRTQLSYFHSHKYGALGYEHQASINEQYQVCISALNEDLLQYKDFKWVN